MIPLVLSVDGVDRLRTALSGLPGTLERQELALFGYRLRLRDQFDELLCLSRLSQIRQLDYQVETVLKVLRTFRGRALLELYALATMQGDEKRELVVSAVLSPFSGTEVVGFAEAAFGLLPDQQAALSSMSEAPLAAALHACARRAEIVAQGFRDSMTRRFERDRGRIEAYFDDLVRELEKRAARGKLDQRFVDEKRNALHTDRSAKLEALSARFVLRVSVMPIALRIVAVEGGFATLMLRRRKATRILELEFDAVTRRIVPPRCDGCGFSAPKPAACDDALHLLCEACAPRAEGRVACPACRPSARASRNVATDAAFPPQP